MRTLLLIALAGILSAAEAPKAEQPKPPTVAELQMKINRQAKELDSLKKQLAEANARNELGWGYYNVCVENQVQDHIRQATAKQTQEPAR